MGAPPGRAAGRGRRSALRAAARAMPRRPPGPAHRTTRARAPQTSWSRPSWRSAPTRRPPRPSARSTRWSRRRCGGWGGAGCRGGARAATSRPCHAPGLAAPCGLHRRQALARRAAHGPASCLTPPCGAPMPPCCPAPQERLAKAAAERIDRAYFHPDSKRHAKDERVGRQGREGAGAAGAVRSCGAAGRPRQRRRRPLRGFEQWGCGRGAHAPLPRRVHRPRERRRRATRSPTTRRAITASTACGAAASATP
jgi:hypothetical protein